MTGSTVSFRMHNPSGGIEANILHAHRLDTLAGKTICELSNAGWEHNRIFPAVREALLERFPTAKIIPYTEVIDSRSDLENLEKVTRIVKEKDCQAVIVGMAA
jgi:hypothetical protein